VRQKECGKREVAVLGETKEQRREETQKAPAGRMRQR